ncbi:MAG TPA: 50S ribosomal protein L25 [Ardenticatenaceae bacterium]|nr:50S ribosomal protein L25 [Ardenticatenaceae bacterium]
MAEITMKAQPRTVTGKKVKSLRRAGVIPVVVYGGTLEGALAAQVDERVLSDTLQRAGSAQVVTIDLDGQQLPSLVREVQRDTLTHKVTHVDFQNVRLDRPIQAQVPVLLVGESALITSDQAVLMHGIDTVEVEALPRALVPHLDVDLSKLQAVGDVITVRDIQAPPGVSILSDPDLLVASAQPLTSEEAVETLDAPETGPELIEGAADDTEAGEDES